jgi:hypothetical protein
MQVRRHNSLGNIKDAKNCSEWVLCSSISSLVLLVFTIMAIIATLLILAFAVDVI